jgi:putative hydrolase of the HAD superfamily
MTRPVLLDLGAVLETGRWPGTAQAWAPRLAIATRQVLAAVFGGSDGTVLTGQMSEDDWWRQVRRRPNSSRRRSADGRLTSRRGGGGTSSSWPASVGSRAGRGPPSSPAPGRMPGPGWRPTAWPVWPTPWCCPVRQASPSRTAASSGWHWPRVGTEPGSALFIDDTPSHVTAAQALGITGHVHTVTRTTEAAIESLAGAA